MKKAFTVLVLFAVLFSGFAMLSPGVHATASAQTRATGLTVTAPVTVDGKQVANVSWDGHTFSIWFVLRNDTAVIEQNNGWTMSYNATTQKLTISDSATGTTEYYTFSLKTDAEGDDYVEITGTGSTTSANYTQLFLYSGQYSELNQNFVAKWVASANYTLYHFYDIHATSFNVMDYKLKDGTWLIAISNSAHLYGLGYDASGAGITNVALAMWTMTDSRVEHELHLVLKVKKPAPVPITASKMFYIYMNSANYAELDNESIYRTAAETYHFEYVTVEDDELESYTYKENNIHIKNAILNISNYVHKYGMKFTVAFYWHDWLWGRFNAANTYNETASQRAKESWQNYLSEWDNIDDFYLFGYGNFRDSGPTAWGYYNWRDLNDVWMNTSKLIFYEGHGDWFVGSHFVPYQYQGEDLAWFDQHYQYAELGDPYTHALNYSVAAWDASIWYDTGNAYNATAAEKVADYLYQFGQVPATQYDVNSTYPFAPILKEFADWRGGMYVYHDIQGTVGTRNVQLENEHEIRLLLTDTESQITVTPHVAKLPVEIYTNKTVKIEYEINPTPNIVVKDLTTGATVHWTKGSVIFSATAGHTYEIVDIVQQSIDLSFDWTYAMIGIMVPLVIFAALMQFFGDFVRQIKKMTLFGRRK